MWYNLITLLGTGRAVLERVQFGLRQNELARYDDQTVFDGRLAAKLHSNFVEHASKYTSDRSDLTATLKVAVFVADNVENVGIGSAPPRALRVERKTTGCD